MLRVNLVGVLMVFGLFLTAPILAAEQKKTSATRNGQTAQIHVEVQLQQLVATVKEQSGKLVPGLRAEDFIVEEDGVRQPLAYFSAESDTPVSLGILLDSSLSMEDKKGAPRLAAAKGVARTLVRLGKRGDEFLLMTFGDSFRLEQDFTADPKAIERRLADIDPKGMTNLYGAVSKAIDKMKRATHRKRALVIITDTVDNREQIPLSALKDRINQQEILIYTVGLFQGGRAQLLGKGAYPAPGMAGPAPSIWESLFGPSALSKNMLETFATESGGRSIALNIYNLTSEESVTSMTLFVYSLSADLRGQYTIGYYAPESGSAGNRVIRIRTASPDFLVQTRRGAPASEPSHRKNSD